MAKILICGGKGQLGTDCNRVIGEDHVVLSHDLDTMDIADPAAVPRWWRPFHRTSWSTARPSPGWMTAKPRRRRRGQLTDWAPEYWHGPWKRSAAASSTSPRTMCSTAENRPGTYTWKATHRARFRSTARPSWRGSGGSAGDRPVRHRAHRMAVWCDRPQFSKDHAAPVGGGPRTRLTVVNDQFGSPTWSWRLAVQIRRLVDAGGRGIYHATAEGYGTWYELARYFLDRMGVAHRIAPCTTADYPTPAVRPQNAILENRRLKEAGINVMVDWRQDLDGSWPNTGSACSRRAKQETTS